MKNNVFVQIVTNCLLVLVIGVVATAVFGGSSSSVFNSNNDYAPIYRGDGSKEVSFMINVYWGNEYLEEMLDILDESNVKCTFFVGGSWAVKYPQLLAQIAKAGHEIGNHGYFHKSHSKLDYNQNLTEIQSCNKVVFELCGVLPTLFTPPSGDFNDETLQASKQSGCKTVLWSRDTIDWRDKDSKLIFERATKNTNEGEIILMHPTLQTKNALKNIISYYQNEGYKIVTVSENING